MDEDTNKLSSRPNDILAVSIISIFIGFFAAMFVYNLYRRWRRRNIAPSPRAVEKFRRGIDKKLLDSIPIVVYSVENRCVFCLNQTECAVCLGELDEADMVRVLPGCKHTFHVSCIDKWFKKHASCPLCRRSPVGATTNDIVIELPTE